jgi:hypothetical protein
MHIVNMVLYFEQLEDIFKRDFFESVRHFFVICVVRTCVLQSPSERIDGESARIQTTGETAR